MIYDIVLIIVFALSIILGFRRGLVRTAIKTFGWLISLIAAVIFLPNAMSILGPLAAWASKAGLWIGAFLLILVLCRLVFALITMMFSNKYHHGLIGLADSLGGAACGFVTGTILCLVISMTLPTIFDMLRAEELAATYEAAKFMPWMYEHNFILPIIKGVLGL